MSNQKEIEDSYYTAIQVDDSRAANSSRFGCFSWKDVSYTVKKGQKTKNLIKDMYGSVQAGELIAIMGSSGAGKSTLLNTLAGRVGPGTIGGEILLDGNPRNPVDWRLICSYVEQDDVLYPNFTVFETLMYTAMLRLPSSLSRVEKRLRVESVIEELGLEECRDTRIGTPERKGISGGERKRLSVGIEMVADPNLIFLDEPTSGLDSFNALNVISFLRNVATRDRKMILLTIHQPRTEILDMFDKIILLSEGRPLWFGPVENVLEHFESLDYHIPPKTSPADFIVDIASPDNRSDELKTESLKRIELFSRAYEQVRNNERHGDVLSQNPPHKQDTSVKWPSTISNELWTLIDRNLLETRRNYGVLATCIGSVVLTAGFISYGYGSIGNDNASITKRDVLFVILSLLQMVTNLMPFVSSFPRQKMVIKRERSGGSYRAFSAFFGKVLSILPITVVATFITSLGMYWFVGLNGKLTRFMTFVLILLSHNVNSTAIGLFLSAAVPSVTVGQIVAPLIIAFFGFIGMAALALPPSLKVIKWISPIMYTRSAFNINEFDDEDIRFHSDEMIARILNEPVKYRSGPEVLRGLLKSVESPVTNVWIYVLLNFGMAVLFLLAGYLVFIRTSAPSLRLK